MSTDAQPQGRIVGWDGVSFAVPANWEVALYAFPQGRLTRLEIEDEYAVRLETEWTRPKRDLDMEDVRKRYQKTIARVTEKAERKEAVTGLSEEWMATAYLFREGSLNQDAKSVFQDKQWLMTAFYLREDGAFFCYMLFHFYPDDQENPPEVMRLVANSFKAHQDENWVWALYDIEFELPASFLLESTKFDIGAKQMVFHWRLRRFYIFFFSIADMILTNGQTPEEWLSGHLNSSREIQGQVFFPAANGEITHRRKRRHLLGHRDEITRWCFKWKSRCKYDKERNQLIAWVYSYRKQADLEMIPESLRFGRDIFLPKTPPDPDWLDKKMKRRAKTSSVDSNPAL